MKAITNAGVIQAVPGSTAAVSTNVPAVATNVPAVSNAPTAAVNSNAAANLAAAQIGIAANQTTGTIFGQLLKNQDYAHFLHLSLIFWLYLISIYP